MSGIQADSNQKFGRSGRHEHVYISSRDVSKLRKDYQILKHCFFFFFLAIWVFFAHTVRNYMGFTVYD